MSPFHFISLLFFWLALVLNKFLFTLLSSICLVIPYLLTDEFFYLYLCTCLAETLTVIQLLDKHFSLYFT